MAEVLAIASGVAGLLTLTIEVFKVSKTYIEGVNGASRATLRVLEELKGLKQVLWELDELYLSSDDGYATVPSFKNDTKECEIILLELRDQLLGRLSGSKLSIKLKALTWPFSEGKTNDLVIKLHRHLQIFQASVNINTNAIVRDTHMKLRDLKEDRKDEKFQSTLAWLSSMNFQEKQDAAFSKCPEGSGSWLLHNGLYTAWKSEKGQLVLWCPGNPGTGKTVMASIIINDISTTSMTETTGLAYVYCDYKNQNNQTASELLACIAKQLAALRNEPPKELSDLARNLQISSRRPNFQQSKGLLQSLYTQFSRIFLVIDALDELQKAERGQFLSALLDMKSVSGNILITSRPNCDDICTQLSDYPRLVIEAADVDVCLFVQQRIKEAAGFSKRVKGFEADLINQIVNAADGMFLLAVLQMNKLVSLRTAAKIQQALNKMPANYDDKLSDLYDDAVGRIQSQDGEDSILGLKILQWLVFAKMPIRVDELRHALAVEWEDDREPPSELDRDNVLDVSDLTDVCAGLVIVEEQSSIIRLVHFTTQEYLNKRVNDLFPAAPVEISKICLAYLSFSEFSNGHAQTDADFEERLEFYPFLRYASIAFSAHLRGDLEERLEAEALSLFQDVKLTSVFMQVASINTNVKYNGYSQNFAKDMNGLHVSASLGLTRLNAKLLELGLTPL